MKKWIVDKARDTKKIETEQLRAMCLARRQILEEETAKKWGTLFPSYLEIGYQKGVTVQVSQFLFCTLNRGTETFEATAICPFCGRVVRVPLSTEAALTELILVIEDTDNPVPNYKHECTAEPPLKDEIPF